jgi:hypothetical protein
MGLFSGLFQTRDPIEVRLEVEYTQGFLIFGQSQRDAKTMARELVSSAKEEVRKRGWESQRPSLGDWMLEQESLDPRVHYNLEELRGEGVCDADIRDWWNLSALERVAMEKADELSRTSMFLACLRSGMDPHQVGKKVFQQHPKYGRPQDGEGEDRPLPIELKGRVLILRERYQRNGAEEFAKRLDGFTSFNAFVRLQIHNGFL